MAKKKKLPGAEIFGIKVVIDPTMNKSDFILNPEKLARAKETISKIEIWLSWPRKIQQTILQKIILSLNASFHLPLNSNIRKQ